MYSDTSVPKVVNLSATVVSEVGLPYIQIKTSIKTFKNPAKKIEVTFSSTSIYSVLAPPCQRGIFVGSLDSPYSFSRDIKESDVLAVRADGQWNLTEYLFKAPLNDKVNQNNLPYCRGEYVFGSMYIEDVAKHYTNIRSVQGVEGGWQTGFGQVSNVWREQPMSATCPKYLDYPNAEIRTICDVGVNVTTTRFTLADSDWINAASELKTKQDAETKAKAEAKAKSDAEASAKQIAEKPACDARKSELSKLSQDFVKFKKANPSKSDEVDSTVARLNSALTSNCVAEVTLMDFQREYQDLTKSSSKKITITCVKGKITKKATGINPKCPSGYKKK